MWFFNNYYLFIFTLKTFYKPSPLNHRPDIADVILLFTDGEPRAKTRKLTAEQTLLAQQCSASLKDDKGVKIIGLAVGLPQVVGKFLPLIKEWSSEDSVFSTKLDELDNVLDQLVAKTCENPGKSSYDQGFLHVVRMTL